MTRIPFGRGPRRWPTLLIFLMITGLVALLLIHHVDQWLAGCEALDVLAGGAYHPSVILIRTPGHGRRDARIVELPKRMAFRQRLRVSHVDACTSETF